MTQHAVQQATEVAICKRWRRQVQLQCRDRSCHIGTPNSRRARVLKSAPPCPVLLDFSRDRQQRRSVGVGRRQCGKGIREARPARRRADAKAATYACVSVRHVGRPGLMRANNGLHFVLAGEAFKQRVDRLSRHAEDMPYAFLAQSADYCVGDVHATSASSDRTIWIAFNVRGTPTYTASRMM